MRMLDLCCGRLGWTKTFLARGWQVVGVDLIEPPEKPAGFTFLQGDILTPGYLEDMMAYFKFDFGCASTPCENFSLFQIRNFHPDPPFPELGIKLFNRARSFFHNAGMPHVMENVRAAQQFVGQAVHHCGSFFLWGDAVPPLIPKGLTKGMDMGSSAVVKGKSRAEITAYRKQFDMMSSPSKSKKRKAMTASVATIPPELANCVAEYAERILEKETTQ